MQRLARGAALTVAILLAACAGSSSRDEPDAKTRLARTNTELGVGYLRQGDRKTAIEKFQKAIEADPKYAPAHHSLAIAYQGFGQIELAETHFRKAVDLLPEDGAIHNNFGAFLCGQQKFVESEEQFKAALRDPAYATPQAALENAGLCMLRIPDYEKAERYLRQALKVDANLPGALLGMARLTFDRNQALNTRGWIQRLESVAPLPPQGLLLAVQAERRLGDMQRANTYAALLNSQFPDSPEAQQLRQADAGLK
jgi:type IV pilus assembly protein PilF